MCEWSNTTLGQLVENGLAELQTGPFGTMLHASAYRANGIPVVAVKHIGDNQLIHSDMPRIDAETVARLRKYKLQANDILFARKGAVSRRALVKAQEEGWVQGSDCIRLRLDSNRINPAFVSYLLGTWAHRTWIEQHAHGATMPSLNQEILDLIPLVLPSKPYQDRIAHILGTLDDKIELNRRMNRTLEAIARAIFKSWFIDFDPIIDNAILNGKPIPDEFAKRAEVRREILARSQPSPPSPLPEVEGRDYRGGFDFSGLVETARELRQNQTPAEEILWELLRDRRFLDLKFRRQHQIGDYIADFYCHDHKLVIELDGGIHQTQSLKDAKRDAYMQSIGMTVLRFPNLDVLNVPEHVLSKIVEAVGVGPSPSGRGGGEGVAGYRHLFPDSFQDSPLGMIPRGWKVVPFAKTVEIIGGGTPKTNVDEYWNGGIPWFSIVDAPAASDIFVVDTERTITPAGLEGSSARLLPRGTTIISARGTVGRLALAGIPMAMNQSCYGLRGLHDAYGYYTYYATRWIAVLLQQMAHGSVFDTITRKTLASVMIPKPGERLIRAFERAVTTPLSRVLANLKEARSLRTCRDVLLPNLLSGELDVGGVL